MAGSSSARWAWPCGRSSQGLTNAATGTRVDGILDRLERHYRLGIKVVEGRRIAEQSLHDGWSGALRRLSRSAEVSELKLDHAGGVVEVPLAAAVAENEVLSTGSVAMLAAVGRRLKALFGGVDQDMEWAIDATGRVVVFQSRPYVERKVL